MLLWLAATTTLDAQALVKVQTYRGEKPYQELRITNVNKPNGNIYRLRVEQNYPDLPRPERYRDWKSNISVKIDGGYMMLVQNERSYYDYDIVCLFYNGEQRLVKELDLCALADKHDCEVCDIRYDNGQLFYNLSCITYSSSLNGLCNKLYCVDVEQGRLLWSSRYLTSRDIFTLDDRYVYTGYGFTDEPDFIYLLDRSTGIVLTECPISSAHEYMQLTPEGLYVEDYNNQGYLFRVVEGNAVKVTGTGVRLRRGPSTSAEIYRNASGATVYPYYGDVLESWGEEGDFNKVRFDNQWLYISKLYTTANVMPRYDSQVLRQAGVRAWTGREDDVVHLEVYDQRQFRQLVGLSATDPCALQQGRVYDLRVDSPLASCVFLSRYGRSGLALFVLSEDQRLFVCDLSSAAIDEGSLYMSEMGLSISACYMYTTATPEGLHTPCVMDFDGVRRELNIEEFYYPSTDEEE